MERVVKALRWTRAEWGMVEAAAARDGMRPTTWVRRQILAKLGVTIARQVREDAETRARAASGSRS